MTKIQAYKYLQEILEAYSETESTSIVLCLRLETCSWIYYTVKGPNRYGSGEKKTFYNADNIEEIAVIISTTATISEIKGLEQYCQSGVDEEHCWQRR